MWVYLVSQLYDYGLDYNSVQHKGFTCPDMMLVIESRLQKVNPNLILQVLKYSQGDVNRMRREWELEKRGTSLIKERDYVEQMHKLEAEKSDLEEQNKNLKATADDMK